MYWHNKGDYFAVKVDRYTKSKKVFIIVTWKIIDGNICYLLGVNGHTLGKKGYFHRHTNDK